MTRQWSRAEKWLMFGSAAACLLALIPAWIYQHQNELPPPPVVVEEVPPQNNAFDLVIQAVAALPPIPPASVPSKKPMQGWKPTGFDNGSADLAGFPYPYTPGYSKVYPLAKKKPYLKASQMALALWRQSLELPLYVPQNIYEAEELTDTERKFWSKRSELTRAVQIQARAEWQRGDNSSSLEWLLAAHRSSCREAVSFYNGHNHPLDYNSFCRACKGREKFIDALKQLMPYLAASQLRQGAKELERNRLLLPSVSEALKVEEAEHLIWAYRLCARNDIRLSDDLKHPERSEITAIEQLRFRWTNKKWALEQLKKQADWVIAQAQLPANQRAVEYPDKLKLKEGDPVSRLSLYNFALSFIEFDRVEAQEIVLLTAMAARAFELEQGHPPRNLNELVPKYLKKIENDPFRPTHQLVYSPDPKSYNQWYIGKPIYTKKLPPNSMAVPQVMPYPSSPVSPPNAGAPSPTGYHLSYRTYKLPFLLYSVGEDGRDDGGMDFKRARAKPTSFPASPSGPGTIDTLDILAPIEWFQVPILPDLYAPIRP